MRGGPEREECALEKCAGVMLSQRPRHPPRLPETSHSSAGGARTETRGKQGLFFNGTE